MFIKKIAFGPFLLKSIFALSLFILILISGISYRHTFELAKATEEVLHTYRVNNELEQIFSFIKDAETGQRGFIITGDSLFLKPYLGAREKVNKSFAILKELTDDNLKQRNNLDTLYYLTNLRFGYLASGLKEFSDPVFNKEELKPLMISGYAKMELLRSRINEMSKLETIYLRERQEHYNRTFAVSPIFIMLGMLFSILVFIISFLIITRDLQILRSTNAKLVIAAESVKHAEEIGAFSSWQWDIETNKITSSDNQFRMLGYEPNSFKLTDQKFLELVHPRDRQMVIEAATQVIQNKEHPAVYFRIVHKNGEVRHYKSLNKLITDSTGKKMLIGINSDITEQHLNNLSLEERNRELEQRNKELASFNHVASHDLQEPLRIVQLYISRIDDRDSFETNEKILGYFDKIKKAVTRMRTLIDALLLFSRTNKNEKVFEAADLNLLLDKSKQDLAQAIDEKKANIHAVELPTLHVIPFQIEQLFTNLIGNALKYSRPNIAPYIKVDCEKIIAKDQPELKTTSKKTYYKISITDNGLGFEQQYAENVFTLFYRLHKDTDHEGTGIGLSICKKIVEIHGGFITASGKLNEGASFSIFLPE